MIQTYERRSYERSSIIGEILIDQVRLYESRVNRTAFVLIVGYTTVKINDVDDIGDIGDVGDARDFGDVDDVGECGTENVRSF